MGEERKKSKVWAINPEGKISVIGPMRRCEDGIRKDLRERGGGGWIGFDWLRIGTSGELL
jgi:hypothetical protein